MTITHRIVTLKVDPRNVHDTLIDVRSCANKAEGSKALSKLEGHPEVIKAYLVDMQDQNVIVAQVAGKCCDCFGMI